MLDDIDVAVLREVSRDARQSLRELARRVKMSAGAVTLRVERLERSGFIRGYHADVDPKSMGFAVRALIGLQITQGTAARDTIAQLREMPDVQSISLVTGAWDFLVELLVRDQDHLREVLVGEVWRLPIFRHSETMIVLDHLERPSLLLPVS